MNAIDFLLIGLAAAVFGYLLYTLIRPEEF